MTRITKDDYKEAVKRHDEAEKVMNAYHAQSAQDFEERWKRFDEQHEAFSDADLVYSATARCKLCGAGLAYPKECGPNHQWTCSNVLKNIGTDKGHEAFPFAFYEIKSENQPSANGATTRPK